MCLIHSQEKAAACVLGYNSSSWDADDAADNTADDTADKLGYLIIVCLGVFIALTIINDKMKGNSKRR